MTVTSPAKVASDTKAIKRLVRYRPRWRTLMGTVLLSIMAVFALEGFFKLSSVGEQEFLQPDPELGCVHIPGKLVTWRLEGFSHDRLSRVGLRDSEHTLIKPPGVYRIALLGDSATEAMQVSLSETYGKVLENLLNEGLSKTRSFSGNRPVKRFEVINFGCSSYSTGQELLQYRREVLPYNVDAVLLMYNRGDSLENVLEPAKRATAELRPYFYLDTSGHLATDTSVLKANADKFAQNPIWEFLRSRSRIYGVINQMNLTLSLNEGRYRKLRSWIARLTQSASINSSPLISYPKQDGLDVTRALISQFAAETKAHHQFFAILTYPNWMGDPKMEEQIALLKPFAQSLGIYFLDLTPVFLNSPDVRANFIDYHFSRQGHELAARVLMKLVQGWYDTHQTTSPMDVKHKIKNL